MSGVSGDSSTASPEMLWWPPNKIAGRWLAPYLASHDKELTPPEGVAVDTDLTAIKWRAMIGRDRDGRTAYVRVRGNA